MGFFSLNLETRLFPDGKKRKLEKGNAVRGLKSMTLGICGKKNAVHFGSGFELWEIKLGGEIRAKLYRHWL